MDKTEKVADAFRKLSENKTLKLFLFYFSALFIFTLLVYMNIKTPRLGDDLVYTFIYQTPNKIKNFTDILHSQYTHYYVWGGRSVVHVIAQGLLMLSPIVSDAINALAFVALIFLIYIHINYKKPFSLSLFLGIFLLLWFLEPFAETVLWITGSANYLWGTIIILLFLLPFRMYEGKKNSSWLTSIKVGLMFPAGIIAGWTNENTGAAMIFIIILFAVYYRLNNQKIPLWTYTALIGAVIGYVLMIIAPGNAARAAGTETNIFLIIYRFFRHTQALLNMIGLLSLASVILAVIYYKRKEGNYKNVLRLTTIYQLGVLSAIYIMVFSPAFPERTWFGVIVFCIIGLGILTVNTDDKTIRNIKYSFVVFGLLTFSFNLFDVYKAIDEVDHIFKEREALIEVTKQQGKSVVVIEPYHISSRYALEDPLYSEPAMKLYYGVEVKYKTEE